jgi:hypothetical protein
VAVNALVSYGSRILRSVTFQPRSKKRLGRYGMCALGAGVRTQSPDCRFPPPWSVEEANACFIVKDSAGQKLAYILRGRAATAISGQPAHQEDGRRIAANIGKLPMGSLLGQDYFRSPGARRC